MSNVVVSTRTPEKLRREITSLMAKVPGAAENAFDKAAKKAGTEGAKQLRRVAPKRTGKSANAWTVKKEKGAYYIHAKAPHYRIPHLLEHGHKTVGKKGKRFTRAFNYIAPVETEVNEKFEEYFEEFVGAELQEVCR